jgi:hypothetical protein
MVPRRVLLLALLAGSLTAAGLGGGVAATAPARDRPAAEKPRYLQLRDNLVGYSLRYPRGWKVERRPVGGTEFSAGARCRSVRVVDFEPPPDSGAGFVLHSFVQVCARRLADGSSLEEFMRTTYGDSFLEEFDSAKVGGVGAYAARKTDQSVIFLQTNDHRIQIHSAVVADAEKRATRRAQVRRIERSYSLLGG